MLPTLAREVFGPRVLVRVTEDENYDAAESALYAEAGRTQGLMDANYLFHSARISQVIQGCGHVVDLGCGPATQLAHLAALNPDVRFTGIDLSPSMLDNARGHIAAQGLGNVGFQQGDITNLAAVEDHSVDGAISTLTLHHLPDRAALARCFVEIRRILRPGGALYLVDFGLLKSPRSIRHFVEANRDHQSPEFSREFENSLNAAFPSHEFKSLAERELPAQMRSFSTAQIPMLNIVKSPDKKLPDALRTRVRAMRRELTPRFRRDLDDMRLFFWLGGLGNDPFGPPRLAF